MQIVTKRIVTTFQLWTQHTRCLTNHWWYNGNRWNIGVSERQFRMGSATGITGFTIMQWSVHWRLPIWLIFSETGCASLSMDLLYHVLLQTVLQHLTFQDLRNVGLPLLVTQVCINSQMTSGTTEWAHLEFALRVTVFECCYINVYFMEVHLMGCWNHWTVPVTNQEGDFTL